MASDHNAVNGWGRGRTILVTGASAGIGAHAARALRRDGWRVLATARKDADIAALRDEGVEAFPMDYADPASIERLVADVLAATGGTLDALVNNGAYAQAGAVEDISTDLLRLQFEANFFGWHDLTRRVIPVMRRQGHGRIVSVSSVLGLVPVRHRGAYVASKYALEGLMLCLRSEVGGAGIHVSLIEPGPTRSSMAATGLARALATIDVEGSVHRADYERYLDRLRRGGRGGLLQRGPEAVYAALKRALSSNSPAPHYPVTIPTRAALLMRRLLPARLLYRLLANRA